jgi:hypothetical protein
MSAITQPCRRQRSSPGWQSATLTPDDDARTLVAMFLEIKKYSHVDDETRTDLVREIEATLAPIPYPNAGVQAFSVIDDNGAFTTVAAFETETPPPRPSITATRRGPALTLEEATVARHSLPDQRPNSGRTGS